MNRLLRVLTICVVFSAIACGDDNEQVTVGIKLQTASRTPTAGQPVAVKVTAILSDGETSPSFRGTVRLSSTDAQAVLPTDLVFTAEDAGEKQVMVTLKTAGLSTMSGTDTTHPGLQGSTSVTVKPGAAASCATSQAPTAAVAGAVVDLTVVLNDAFGNVATGYAGTIRLTATDARAVLPANVTYSPAADAGRHAFSAALVTAGAQTLTATDTANAAIHCDAVISVSPAARKVALTLPSDANAGYAVNIGVAVTDFFDNAIPNYTGTVTFTSSDTGTGAVTPAPLTFTGSEGGVGSTSATFMTLGTQTIIARDGGSPVATGNAASTVHGLVYTAPTKGRVRLVANTAQSNAQVVQLDLVATERLETSSFFGGGGPGSFAMGMNLPLDTTRVAGDTTLFTPGPALVATINNAPPAPPTLIQPVALARIGTDHVLYTGVSRKRLATTNFTQRNEVQAGQAFYSIRLKLQQAGTVGPVFDGAQPSPLFRAAVRDQYGDDFVSQGDFGIGKLEIR